MEYLRDCPICKKQITYRDKYKLKRAEENKSKCKSCMERKRVIPLNVNSHFCKICNKELFYKSRKSLLRAIKQKSSCISCFANEKFKLNLSSKTRGENNPMYNKSFYDIWEEKYGEEEAKTRELLRRKKLSESTKGEKSSRYGKPSHKGSGNGWSGYYKKVYFRSFLELRYLKYLFDNNIQFENGEKRKYKVTYFFFNGTWNYFLDFYLPQTNEYIELKPKRLVGSPRNLAKFDAAYKKFGDKFKVLTEKDIENFDLELMYQSYLEKDLIWDKKYEYKFIEYYNSHKKDCDN